MRVYNGPSKLNARPIQVVITGLDKRSKNPKTGDMAQTYIMPARVLECLRRLFASPISRCR